MIRQVNATQLVIDRWTLGGGTALMLQLQHRESRDIDIFLSDPQALRFLDPSINDFEFEQELVDYLGDGARFLKLTFDELGEIDFIAAAALTSTPYKTVTIADETVCLETVAEIVAKKIFHRGASIKPRDVFDIAAAADQYSGPLVSELRPYKEQVQTALSAIDRLNPDFVREAIEALAITDAFRPLANSALDRARSLLAAV